MNYEKIDEVALEKLAWVIAEEFVESCRMLDSLDRVLCEPEMERARAVWGRLRFKPLAKRSRPRVQNFLLYPAVGA